MLAIHSDFRLTTQAYAHVQAEVHRRAAGVLDLIGLEGKEVRSTCCQTRQFEGVVGKPVRVRELASLVQINKFLDKSACYAYIAFSCNDGRQ